MNQISLSKRTYVHLDASFLMSLNARRRKSFFVVAECEEACSGNRVMCTHATADIRRRTASSCGGDEFKARKKLAERCVRRFHAAKIALFYDQTYA
jgi:hypothetical protein